MDKLVESSLPKNGGGDAKTRITKAVIDQANQLENTDDAPKAQEQQPSQPE